MFTHLSAWCSYGPPGRELFYWRSTSKDEVDFIVTRDKVPELAIEVKSTTSPKSDHLQGLKFFGEDFPTCQKILLCFVDEPRLLEGGIRVEPVGAFLQNGWEEFCDKKMID